MVHRAEQGRARGGSRVARGDWRRPEANIPVPPAAESAIAPTADLSGLEALHGPEKRSGLGHRTRPEVAIDRLGVEVTRHEARGKQRPHLRPEQQPSMLGPVVQRLDAEPVSRQQAFALALVPDRQRKHPAQLLDAGFAACLVGSKNHFSVALGHELDAFQLERPAQFAKVVDLAAEDDGQAAVWRGHRLMPGGAQVDDRQSRMREAGHARRGVPLPHAVRATVSKRRLHRVQGRTHIEPAGAHAHDAGDATHGDELRWSTNHRRLPARLVCRSSVY